MAAWARAQRVALDEIEPGQPAQNAFIERFGQTCRIEILDAHVLPSLAALRAITADWLRRYNTQRPHDSLGNVPPLTFLPSVIKTIESTYALSA